MDEVDASTVVAWMAETGRGYKAAATHFGAPLADVRRWGRAARNGPKPKQPTGPRKPPPPTRVRARVPTRRQLLEDQYVDAIDAVAQATKDRSHQAVVSARRQVLAIHTELVAVIDAEKEAAEDDMTEAEFTAGMVESLRALPRDLAQRIMDEAHPAPGLRVVQ